MEEEGGRAFTYHHRYKARHQVVGSTRLGSIHRNYPVAQGIMLVEGRLTPWDVIFLQSPH